jgi:hypothetical protein
VERSLTDETSTDPAEAPRLDPRQVGELLVRLRSAREQLVKRSTDDLLASLAIVAEEWLQPQSKWRRAAEMALPAATGFSPEMVHFGLPLMIEPLRAPAVGDLLDAELGDRRALDARGSGARWRSPALVVHVLSGNLPGLAAVPAVLTLAVKSAALLKAARGDRVFPALFARSIAEVDPGLGRCTAACYWPGGGRRCEEPAFAAADAVVALGDDGTVEDIRARVPGRFIGHGHRISLALVTGEVLRDAAAARAAAQALALDVALWDQLGCLSPQACYVEGCFAEAVRFADSVAAALRSVARCLPAGEASAEERIERRRFRDDAEWRQIAGQRVALFTAGDTGDGTVVVEAEGVFGPTPLGRSLRILPLARVADLIGVLSPARRVLEAAGLAAQPSRRQECADILNRCGVHRVCELGEMQRPPLAWRQGGRPRVADWLARTV